MVRLNNEMDTYWLSTKLDWYEVAADRAEYQVYGESKVVRLGGELEVSYAVR